MGRKKMFTERMVAPFPTGYFALMDKARGKRHRTAFVLTAVNAYLISLGYADDVGILLTGCLNNALKDHKELRKKAHAVRAG